MATTTPITPAPSTASASNPSGTPGASRPRSQRVLRYVLALITSVLVIDALVGEKGLIEIIRARRAFAALEQSLASARTTNARLRAEAKRLREDPRAIEDVARRDLGLLRPGEKLFIVKDVESPSP